MDLLLSLFPDETEKWPSRFQRERKAKEADCIIAEDHGRIGDVDSYETVLLWDGGTFSEVGGRRGRKEEGGKIKGIEVGDQRTEKDGGQRSEVGGHRGGRITRWSVLAPVKPCSAGCLQHVSRGEELVWQNFKNVIKRAMLV